LLISIAMCTYNGQRFLKEQIDSILNQSFTEIELIITDDCSTDNTWDILLQYKKQDSRIKIYKNKKNLGFVKNFEKAISLCSGEYIALTDQDDIWKRDKLKKFLKEIGSNILIYSDALLIDNNSKILNKTLIAPGILATGKCNKSFLIYNSASGNTMMFKKELVSHILPIPKKISFHDIWIVFVAATVGTINITQEPMTYYRRYNEQITKTLISEYKSFFDKMQQREKGTIQFAQSTLQNCELFIQLNELDDEAKFIIELLINHYKNYNKGFFNFKLFYYLIRYKNEVFGVKPKRKRVRYARKTAMKLNFKRTFLYKI